MSRSVLMEPGVSRFLAREREALEQKRRFEQACTHFSTHAKKEPFGGTPAVSERLKYMSLTQLQQLAADSLYNPDDPPQDVLDACIIMARRRCGLETRKVRRLF